MDLLAPLVGRPNHVTREAGHVGLMGRNRGGGSIKWRTCIIYNQCFFRHVTHTCIVTRRQRLSKLVPSVQAWLSGGCGQGLNAACEQAARHLLLSFD